ncbi:MAG: head completion/stabilization protein [Novosphingobium sp.]|nr:head completion/stabilization protein [Novosphingobium sp.]
MSGFVSSPAAPASAPGTVLECGPFWPDIDLNGFRDSQRIGGTLIPDNRVKDALQGAVMTVDADLDEWRTAQEEGGHARLADVPSTQIGTETRHVLLWRRAVYAYATADLVETHRDVTATGNGQAAAPELDQRAEDHRRNALHAIRAILGKGRTAVELI